MKLSLDKSKFHITGYYLDHWFDFVSNYDHMITGELDNLWGITKMTITLHSTIMFEFSKGKFRNG